MSGVAICLRCHLPWFSHQPYPPLPCGDCGGELLFLGRESVGQSSSHSTPRDHVVTVTYGHSPWELATLDAQSTLQRTPHHVGAWRVLAEHALSRREFDSAASYLAQWVSLAPDPLPIRWLAEVYLLLHQPDRALSHLAAHLSVFPDDPWVHLWLGVSCIEMGRWRTADIHLQAATAFDTQGRVAHRASQLLAVSRHHLATE